MGRQTREKLEWDLHAQFLKNIKFTGRWVPNQDTVEFGCLTDDDQQIDLV